MKKTIGLSLAVFLIGAIIGFNLYKIPYFETPTYTGKGGEDTPPLMITPEEYFEEVKKIRVKCKELDRQLGIIEKERGE